MVQEAVQDGGGQDLVPKISPQSRKLLFEVRMRLAFSYRRQRSRKKRLASSRDIGRYPISSRIRSRG
jgi:hypothetical protein